LRLQLAARMPRSGRWVIMVVVLATALFLIASGRLSVLAVVTGLAFSVALSWYEPIPLVLLILVLSTQVLQFVSLEYIPYWQITAGLRLNAQDIGILLLLAIGGLRLLRRRERPMFLQPLVFFGGAIALASVLGWVAGSTTPDATLNALRAYSGYLFYVGLVGVMDSPRRVQSIINILFLLVAVSVGVQLLEAIRGERIVTPFAPASEYFSGTKLVTAGGIRAPYLWNRATGYLFLGLFLALGALIHGRADAKHLFLGIWAVVGVVIALVRQWFVIIGCGVVLLALLSQGRRLRAFGKSVAVVVLVLVAVNLIGQQIPAFSLLDALRARVDTILAFQQEPNYLGRVLIQQQMVALFIRSPIFGYGPGSGLASSDVGVYNALVELGLIGTASVAYLIGFVFVRSYHQWKQVADSRFSAYLAGLLAAWVSMLVGYVFSTDFIGQMSMVVALAMALMDRLSKFAAAAPFDLNPA